MTHNTPDPTVDAWFRPDVEAAAEARLEDSCFLALTREDDEPEILDETAALDFDAALIDLETCYHSTLRADGIAEARRLVVVQGLKARRVIAEGMRLGMEVAK